MMIKSLTSGVVALLCVVGLVEVTGYISRVAAPVRPVSTRAARRAWDDADEQLLIRGFNVKRGGPFRLTLESNHSRVAQMRTARRVRDCLSGAVLPEYGLSVDVWRQDGPEVVSCVADGVRWRLVNGLCGRPPDGPLPIPGPVKPRGRSLSP